MANYDYYRIFYYVAQYKSFSRAAEILENNQPNITRCMNNLENELGCKLFVRTNRGVTLTPEGTRLYEHVAVAFEQIEVAEKEISMDNSLESGIVTIGASETALRLMLLNKLEEFHEKYPRVRLRISNHSSPQAVKALEDGLVDFAVVTTPITIKKPLQKTSLYSFREILIGGRKYSDIAAKMQSINNLADIPFISLGGESATRELYMQYFLNHNMPFNPDMEAATTDQILPMVRSNLGIGFCPEGIARPAVERGEVYEILLEEEIPERQITLVEDSGKPQSIAVQKLLTYFK